MNEGNLVTKGFIGPNGVSASFLIRTDTNDENTCQAVFRDDEYKIQNMEPKAGDWIIDAGAHIGTFSILAAKLYPDTPVVAVEPLPENLEILQKNIALNMLGGKITVIGKALWSTDGEEIKMYYREAPATDRIHRFMASAYLGCTGIEQSKASLVCTIRLSTIFQLLNINSVRVLKMDTQASELEILKGIVQEDLVKIQTIAGEYHARDLEQDLKPRSGLFKIVEGYFDDKSVGEEKTAEGPILFERKI